MGWRSEVEREGGREKREEERERGILREREVNGDFQSVKNIK